MSFNINDRNFFLSSETYEYRFWTLSIKSNEYPDISMTMVNNQTFKFMVSLNI